MTIVGHYSANVARSFLLATDDLALCNEAFRNVQLANRSRQAQPKNETHISDEMRGLP